MSTAEPSTHRERLWPAPWVWLVCLLVASSAGLVVIVALGPIVAAVVAALAVATAAVALVTSSAVVEVRGGRLRAGRAVVPVRHLGRVRVLDAARMSALRGPQANARAYLCQRAWIRRGVVVELVDPADPVPYWLISSRKPERLAAALEGARGEPSSEVPDGSAGSGRAGPSGQAHSRHTG